MKYLKVYRCLVPVIILIALFSSCRQKLNLPSTDREMLAPFAKSSLSINQILTDSLVSENSDNSLTLIYREDFASFNFDSLVDIPNSEFNRTTKISNLELGDRSVNTRISLGMIANNWPVWGPVIIAAHGSSTVLPDISGVTAGPFQFSIDDIFQTATFDSGYIDITIKNNFPIDIANLEFQLRNSSDGSVVAHETFAYIPSGAQATKTIDISGLTIEGILDVEILNLDILGGNQNVPIDTSDDLAVTLLIRDVQLQSATAVFPAQNLIDEEVNTDVPIENIKLKNTKVKSGNVVIEVTSTIEDSIYFTYSIPPATLNSVPFLTNVVIPPAPPGGSVSDQFVYDFSGYELGLGGEFGDSTNVIFSHLTGRIDSTGKIISLSKSDSLVIRIYTEKLVPSYVEGFLGNEIINVTENQHRLTLFDKIISGSLDIEQVRTTLTIENYLGIKGSLFINNLSAVNSKTGASVTLTGDKVGTHNVIDQASDNPFTPTSSTVQIDESNSNITEFVGILPDELNYDLSAYLNYGIDTFTTDYKDFIYDTATISTSLEMEIPLSLVANNLTLLDTTDFALENGLVGENELSGYINLIVDNGFPVSATINIYLLDNNLNMLDSLITTSTIKQAATLNGKVTAPIRTVNSFAFDNARLDRIASAEKMIILAKFNSEDAGFDKIYSDYTLGVLLTGDFITK